MAADMSAHEGTMATVYVDESVLLVRSPYRSGRDLPGVGVRRGEPLQIAAQRELAEKISLSAAILCAVV
jgi:ADP-ribose pyrophosphatase YjhB (NUDIX family)